MKFTNTLVFATAASAAAVQSQRIRVDNPQDTGANILEVMRLDIPKMVDTDILKGIRLDIPKMVDTDIPQEVDTDIPQKVDTDIPQEVDTDIPQKVDTDIPQEVDTDIPQKVDTNIPQKVDTDILKNVDTTLEAAITALNQGNQSLNNEFFQSRFYPIFQFVEHKTAKIDASRGDLSMDDADRLFKPAANLPRLAVALHSAMDKKDVKATIVQNKACGVARASIFGLQAALNNFSRIVGYALPEIAKNTDYKTLNLFTLSLAETGKMFKDC
ncbi:hypothetical protein RJ55_05655 [Drechmeria coniospora]|nr:hypothetical protein RJ55_05655 [Drechmeria coniospora]